MVRDRKQDGTPPEAVISIIGPGMKVVGDCVTTGSLRIEGAVEGAVRAGDLNADGLPDLVIFNPHRLNQSIHLATNLGRLEGTPASLELQTGSNRDDRGVAADQAPSRLAN